MESTAGHRYMNTAYRWRDRLHHAEDLAFHHHVVGYEHVGVTRPIVVIDRILAPRDARHLAHRRGHLGAHVAGVFAEGPIGLPHIGGGPPFDHDLCVSRHHDLVAMGNARHEA